jgi:4-hydroxy-3-methylbut-2-enyl diphosphate reductase
MFEETEARTDEISGGAADSGVMTAQAAPEELAPQETIAGEPGSQEPETAPEAPPIQEEQADELYEPENLEDDADEESFEDNPQMFDEILEKSINKTLVTGDSVTGVIAAITQTEVTVDLGIKQPGYIPISELLEDHVINFEEDIKVGASIEAVVARISDYYGTVELSRRGLAAIRTWHELEEAMNTRTVVEGSVVETNKGGVLVSVRGIRVFVPAGRTGLPRGRELTELLKKKARLLINEVNISRGRVIGSISAAAKKERWERLQQIFSEIEPGQRRRGVIKSVKDFGVFVDIGGADGLVHISQLSWIRGMKPADLGDIGDETEVIVLSADKETGRISLSCKLPENDPWANFVEKYKVGDVVPAKVVRLVSFGAFAEIIPGVDGLIHISQITDRRIENPAEGISRDAVTDVKIIGINNETRRVSLSIRELLWEKRRAQEAEAFEEAETFEEAVAPEEAAESESAEPSTETPDESAAPQAAETSAPAEASDTPAEPSAPEEAEPPKEAEAPDAPEAPAEL